MYQIHQIFQTTDKQNYHCWLVEVLFVAVASIRLADVVAVVVSVEPVGVVVAVLLKLAVDVAVVVELPSCYY